MALELLVVRSRCVSFIVACTAALAVGGVAELPFRANQWMWYTLCFGGILWGGALLVLEFLWTCVDDLEPGSVALLVLFAVDWAVACLTVGSACAALAANHYAIHHQYKGCDPEIGVCMWYITAAAMALIVGALARRGVGPRHAPDPQVPVCPGSGALVPRAPALPPVLVNV